MDLVAKLTGKIKKAYEDNITANERVDVMLEPAIGEGIVVTDRRVMIIKAGLCTNAGLFGATTKSFYFSDITSVDLRVGIMGGHLQITVAGSFEKQDQRTMDMARAENAVTFVSRYKGEMKEVANLIRERAMAAKQPRHNQTAAASTPDLVQQLTGLAQLRNDGILTQAEFDAKKRQLLGLEGQSAVDPAREYPSDSAQAEEKTMVEQKKDTKQSAKETRVGCGVLIVLALIVIGGIGALIDQFSGDDDKPPALQATVTTESDQERQQSDASTSGVVSSGTEDDMVLFSLTTGKEIGVVHVEKPTVETIKTPYGEFGVMPEITSADVKLNLQKTWGLKWTGVQTTAIEGWYTDEGSTIDPDTLTTLTATVQGRLPDKICEVEFMVDASTIAGLVDPSSIVRVAQGYLGFAATIPALPDKANQLKAKEWVEANVSRVQIGSPAETDIGPLHFILSGGQWIKTLEVSVPVKGD